MALKVGVPVFEDSSTSPYDVERDLAKVPYAFVKKYKVLPVMKKME